ncbi:hypothetical protein SAMN05421504_102520 [Amycolatopsis xylanica]|uniref:Uncharacterized protein n=1 Tax=Amycolatopsis xylanica TaxID=589385 RepID=A0A1H2ZGQ7_9PSEU|nr:hypothetical protein [Amycolatopsis xylanica]SDX16653.1 hypothetical protein SAMN05421504_102520 [Amycolatopsis xylanica]
MTGAGGIEELHQLLQAVQAGVVEASAHFERAKALLEDATRAIVEAQAKAEPWQPPELAKAIEALDAQLTKMAGVTELLTAYQSRL